jgi:hypothetical protein
MPTKPKITSRTKSASMPKSKISSKLIAAIIIGVVAIAGIAIVFSSFASGLPAYQYSYNASCEKKTTNINVKTNQIVTTTGADIVTVPIDPKSDCVKDSAEAMAYRLYYVTYAKDPLYDNAKSKDADPSTYAGLVQALAGNRTKPQLIFPNDTYRDPADLSAFVRTMYKNAVNRTASDKEVNDWVKNIKDNNLDRADVATLFAEAPEAKVNLSGKFANYIKSNPKPVTIIPTAQNQQNTRAAEAKKKAERMKALNDEIQNVKNIGVQVGSYTAAKSLAENINKNMIDSKKLYDEIEGLYVDSKDLSVYATNISYTDISTTKNQAYEYLKKSWTNTLAMASYIGGLRASGANTSGTVPSVSVARRDVTGCNLAINSITKSSGSPCIRKLQQAYGLKADGVWGPATQSKVCAVRKNCGSGNSTSRGTSTPRTSTVPIDNGGVVTRVPNNNNTNNIPSSGKPTNTVGTSMCRTYKNNRPGAYTDYEYKKAVLFLYRQNSRIVNCFKSGNSFVGYAGAWRGWSNPIYTTNKQVGNRLVHARDFGLY